MVYSLLHIKHYSASPVTIDKVEDSKSYKDTVKKHLTDFLPLFLGIFGKSGSLPNILRINSSFTE